MSNLFNKAIPVIFVGGSYGSFLARVLSHCTAIGNPDNVHLPHKFSESGGSHTLFKEQIANDTAFKNGTAFKKRHFHTINYKDELRDIIADSDRAIIIQHDGKHRLEAANNVFSKRYNHDVHAQIDGSNFEGSDYNTPDITSRSMIREYFSFKLFHHPELTNVDHQKALSISIDDILYNFKDMLIDTADKLGTHVIDLNRAVKLHAEMMNLQVHLNKDKDFNNFLHNFVNHIDCKLPSNCSIIDEAYIQKYLRDELNLELRCNDIGDNFPKSTTALWKYTYPKDNNE